MATGILVLSMSCGSDGSDRNVASVDRTGDGATDRQLSDEEIRLAYEQYRQCMAEHGIDADTVDGDERGTKEDADTGDTDVSQTRLAEAERECGPLLPDGGELSEPSAEDLDKQRDWLNCLRAAGLEVVDTGNGMPSVGIPEGDEQAEKALQECDQKVYGVDQTTTESDSE